MTDINKNAVDFVDNYDVTAKEPISLPVPTSVLLLNGSFGIAGGYSQSVLPHNMNDLAKCIIKLIKEPDTSVKEIAKNLMPDFPTGGIICSGKQVREAYETGRGTVKVRCTTSIKEEKNGTSEIIIHDIPYMVTIGSKSGSSNTSGLIPSITSKIVDGTIEGISSVDDYSDGKGINIRIKIKKGFNPNIILNKLYKYTLMETTLTSIFICKDDNSFKQYNIKEILESFIDFRRKTLKRIIAFEINSAKKRKHILDGLVYSYDYMDKIISIIRSSESKEKAKEKLIKNFKSLTTVQIDYILDMRLHALNNLEKSKLEEEINQKIQEINELTENLKNENIDKRIINEQKELAKIYGSPRKTKIEEINSNIEEEDLIEEEDCIVVTNTNNYIKRISSEKFKTQNRNTKGSNIGDNEINEMFPTTLKSHLYCFTNKGKVYSLKVWKIKECKKISDKGSPIEMYLNLSENEKVTNIFCINPKDFNENNFLLIATKNGKIKKTSLDEYKTILKMNKNLIAIKLSDNDEVLAVRMLDSTKKFQDIVVCTNTGLVLRYNHKLITPTSRNTMGVNAIKLDKDKRLVDFIIINENTKYIFFGTENGIGKRVPVKKIEKVYDCIKKEKVDRDIGFPRSVNRPSSNKGRLGINLSKDDSLVHIIPLDKDEDNELMITTNKKFLVIKTGDIKILKRPTKGVRLIKLEDDDKIINIIRK